MEPALGCSLPYTGEQAALRCVSTSVHLPHCSIQWVVGSACLLEACICFTQRQANSNNPGASCMRERASLCGATAHPAGHPWELGARGGGAGAARLRGQRGLGDLPGVRGPAPGHPGRPAAPAAPAQAGVHRARAARIRRGRRRACARRVQAPAPGGGRNTTGPPTKPHHGKPKSVGFSFHFCWNLLTSTICAMCTGPASICACTISAAAGTVHWVGQSKTRRFGNSFTPQSHRGCPTPALRLPGPSSSWQARGGESPCPCVL